MRVGKLFADSDLESRVNELFYVDFGAVKRNSAHRRAGSRSENQLKLARNGNRVVKEHLVKIAKTEKQDIVGVFFLDFPVLFKHRGLFSGHFFLIHTSIHLNQRRVIQKQVKCG